MRQRIEMAVLVVALIVVGTSSRLIAQGTVSLEDQLKAQYTMVKMGSDSSGAAVVEQGSPWRYLPPTTVVALPGGGLRACRFGSARCGRRAGSG